MAPPGLTSFGTVGGGIAGSSGVSTASVRVTKEDFDTFERLLGEVTVAYGAANLGRLGVLATPEMTSYLADDLSRYGSRGLINEVGDITLEQGDLAEAWREGDDEYATVAMRYRLKDAWVDRTTNLVVEGSRELTEVTELWTFQRSRGRNWLLSAIQQTN